MAQVIERFCKVPGGVAHVCLNPAGGWVVSAMAAATEAADGAPSVTLLSTRLPRAANPDSTHKRCARSVCRLATRRCRCIFCPDVRLVVAAGAAVRAKLQTAMAEVGEHLKKANPAVWHKCGMEVFVNGGEVSGASDGPCAWFSPCRQSIDSAQALQRTTFAASPISGWLVDMKYVLV